MLRLKLPRVLKFTLAGREFHTLTLSVIGVGATTKEHVSGPCQTISFTLWRNGTYLVQGNNNSTKYLLFTYSGIKKLINFVIKCFHICLVSDSGM